MLDVCLLGTGGMMPLPGRWLTSLMTRLNGSSLLIDCGEGTQITIKEKGWSFHPIDTICFTHYHGDHISGLPGLLLSMGNADRTEPVTMIGPKGLEKVVNALRVIAPELPFELRFVELSGPSKLLEV
ncbi:MAG: MBL fold metallo-hydrolase, partial [Acetivibrio ethanolgignens]